MEVDVRQDVVPDVADGRLYSREGVFHGEQVASVAREKQNGSYRLDRGTVESAR